MMNQIHILADMPVACISCTLQSLCYVAKCWSSHHQMLWSLLGSKGSAVQLWTWLLKIYQKLFMSHLIVYMNLSAANPKNLNMVKKLSLAMLTQECGKNLKSLTTMGSEGCQNAGKEVVNHERISTPATKSS
ncbi:unnamed protein product [Brassica oleracea var. botrytis]